MAYMRPARLKTILATVLAAAGLAVRAYVNPSDLQTETVGGITWSYAIADGCATVTSWNMQTAIPQQTSGAVEVPSTLGGCPVRTIGSYAFFQMGGITSLAIPEGVETIEFYMCRGCTGLKTVSLPSTLKTLGNGVFSGCTNLLACAIPDSVTAMGYETFWGCKSMTSVRFSENVKTLDSMTCYDCDSLTDVVIPYGVTVIGVSAFLDCDNLSRVSIPDSVAYIDNYAFNRCISLKTLYLPPRLTVVNDIFSGCESLGDIFLHAGIRNVDPFSFVGCSSLTNIEVEAGNAAYMSVDGVLFDATGNELVAWPHGCYPVVIPAGVKRIGDGVFSGRRDLTGIDIPEGVESVGNSAFDMCTQLAAVTFPSTLRTIGERAFFKCPVTGTLSFAPGLETIGNMAFMRSGIGSLVLPVTTTLVDTEAFRECTSLQSLTVMSSNCVISANAFAGCQGLESISIAEGAVVDSAAFGVPPHVEPDEPDVPVEATIRRDCFDIVHDLTNRLVCTVKGLECFSFSVERCASNDWAVSCTYDSACHGHIEKSAFGGHLISDRVAQSGKVTITGTGDRFVFEFGGWVSAMHDDWYGYISLGLDANAELAILDSAVCDKQNALSVTGVADKPGTGDNCLIVHDSNNIVFGQSPDVRFYVTNRRPSGNLVLMAESTQGSICVAEGVIDEPVCEETFSNRLTRVESTGGVVRVAFKWQNKDAASRLYGWMSLEKADGILSIIAQEVAYAPNEAVIGRNDPTAVPPDDIDVLDGILWQCDFETERDGQFPSVIPGLEKHFVRGGDIWCQTRTNYMGRACVEFSEKTPCLMMWFSLYDKGNFSLGNYSSYECVGDYFKPKLWESIGVAFRLWSDSPCTEDQMMYSELPLRDTTWSIDLQERLDQAPHSTPPIGSVINIDDKMSLRYFIFDEGDGACRTNWQLNAGFVNSSSNIVERTVELASAFAGKVLPSPVGRWTTVRVEAENVASAGGPAFRVYIGGMPAVCAADGQGVFFARPSASDRTGFAALGLGGAGYVDDVTFFSKSSNPMNGIYVTPCQEFTEEEAATIAALVGANALDGLRGVFLRDRYDEEAAGAYKTCVQLGITPKDIDRSGDELTLSFKSPTVTITAIDLAARTVTGQVVPAEGTRIAAPPMTYMFGLDAMADLGTEWQTRTEYGYECARGYDGFSVDLANYLTSNGVFTIKFPDHLLDKYKDSAFFSLSLKDYR